MVRRRLFHKIPIADRMPDSSNPFQELLETDVDDGGLGKLRLGMIDSDLDRQFPGCLELDGEVMRSLDGSITRYAPLEGLMFDVCNQTNRVDAIFLRSPYRGRTYHVRIGNTIADLKNANRGIQFSLDDEFFYVRGSHIAVRVNDNPVFVPESMLVIETVELTATAN